MVHYGAMCDAVTLDIATALVSSKYRSAIISTNKLPLKYSGVVPECTSRQFAMGHFPEGVVGGVGIFRLACSGCIGHNTSQL